MKFWAMPITGDSAWDSKPEFRRWLSVRLYGVRYRVQRFREWRYAELIAHRLPRKIAYFAYVRVVANASAEENRPPDDYRYAETCDAWESHD